MRNRKREEKSKRLICYLGESKRERELIPFIHNVSIYLSSFGTKFRKKKENIRNKYCRDMMMIIIIFSGLSLITMTIFFHFPLDTGLNHHNDLINKADDDRNCHTLSLFKDIYDLGYVFFSSIGKNFCLQIIKNHISIVG